jgi:hypothetical protein
MAVCEVCGNDYDKTFEVGAGGAVHIFDSFECAIQALAPSCAHCGCRIIGHGVRPTAASSAVPIAPSRRAWLSCGIVSDLTGWSRLATGLRLPSSASSCKRLQAAALITPTAPFRLPEARPFSLSSCRFSATCN